VTIRAYLSALFVSDALCHNGNRAPSDHVASRRRWRDRGTVHEALVVGHDFSDLWLTIFENKTSGRMEQRELTPTLEASR
jgi:hypothetical protein